MKKHVHLLIQGSGAIIKRLVLKSNKEQYVDGKIICFYIDTIHSDFIFDQ
jgi:hypothetical protein